MEKCRGPNHEVGHRQKSRRLPVGRNSDSGHSCTESSKSPSSGPGGRGSCRAGHVCFRLSCAAHREVRPPTLELFCRPCAFPLAAAGIGVPAYGERQRRVQEERRERESSPRQCVISKSEVRNPKQIEKSNGGNFKTADSDALFVRQRPYSGRYEPAALVDGQPRA